MDRVMLVSHKQFGGHGKLGPAAGLLVLYNECWRDYSRFRMKQPARWSLPSSDNRHTLSCVVIFDASTLILLAKSDLLDLFLNDFPSVPLMPGAVEAESTGYPDRPDAILIQQRLEEGRLTVEEVRHPRVVARLVQDFRLGAGEAEALALALEKGEMAVVATDDRNAIRACKVLRIGFVTSLGILVRAVEKDLLTPEDGMRCLERLRAFGRFRVEVIEEVSRQIGGSHGESSEDG